MPIKEQPPREAHETLKRNPEAIYLDVRTEGEFAQGHPAGAINIPVVFMKGPGQMQLNPDFSKSRKKYFRRIKPLSSDARPADARCARARCSRMRATPI